jgi:glycosyltransferase
MKISIVTVVLNSVDTIGEALTSVQRQTYRAVEHILQDGGSNDGTLEVIQSHNSPYIKLISEYDRGIYDAINRGTARASGDVVGLMHSDDVFANCGVLEKVAEAFENPDIDCLYGDLQYVSSNDLSRVIRNWTSGPYSRDSFRRGWMPPHPTFFIRRPLPELLGGYDTSFEIAADYDAMLRWLWKERLRPAYLPEVMVKMRMGGESNRSIGRILQKSWEDYRALKQNRVGGISALTMKNLRKLGQFRVQI